MPRSCKRPKVSNLLAFRHLAWLLRAWLELPCKTVGLQLSRYTHHDVAHVITCMFKFWSLAYFLVQTAVHFLSE